jgi:hypothetical protein
MLKAEELRNPNSCLNKALDGEMIFVLLERDAATPATIRFWAQERIRLGKNLATDEQIIHALEDADRMVTK